MQTRSSSTSPSSVPPSQATPGEPRADIREFALPDVGEGLTEADIVAWHVAPGDTVSVNQTLVEIETAKSVVELPSPFAGVVTELLFEVGDTAEVGAPIIRIGSPGDDLPRGAEEAEPEEAEPAAEEVEPKLLVGYGNARSGPPRRRSRPTAKPADDAPSAAPQTPRRPRAKPPVRKLAKDLGVDLADVQPTGPDGTITREDIRAATTARTHEAVPVATQTGVSAAPQTGAPAAPGEQRIPIKGVRKHTAAAMVTSAFTAPHVTEFITFDITETLELRDVVQRRPEFRDVRLTPLALIARAYLMALARTPMATAKWHEETQEIVVPTDINLGIAAATPRGLVVPHVKRAQHLDLRELATSIDELARTARAGKTPPDVLTGGTTTLTNVGVFGVDTGTPLLNPGETAILAVGAINRRPWVSGQGGEERLEIRSVLQLALSFDHRVMDGQQGSQVLADTVAVLARPGLAML